MNQLMGLVEKLKSMGIVEFFSGFFTEERMVPVLGWFTDATSGGRDPSDYARDLLLVAVLLALITFAVDQLFYWTNPAQIDRARSSLTQVGQGFRSLGQNARYVADRLRGRK